MRRNVTESLQHGERKIWRGYLLLVGDFMSFTEVVDTLNG